MTTRYGKIGTGGQSTTKSYDSPEKAAAETAKTIAKKVEERYVEKTLLSATGQCRPSLSTKYRP